MPDFFQSGIWLVQDTFIPPSKEVQDAFVRRKV